MTIAVVKSEKVRGRHRSRADTSVKVKDSCHWLES